MEWLDAVQWPAMVVTIGASWLVGAQQKRLRAWGFWVFLISNLLWVVWAWHTQAWALLTLQLFLAAMNVRGTRKNED